MRFLSFDQFVMEARELPRVAPEQPFPHQSPSSGDRAYVKNSIFARMERLLVEYGYEYVSGDANTNYIFTKKGKQLDVEVMVRSFQRTTRSLYLYITLTGKRGKEIESIPVTLTHELPSFNELEDALMHVDAADKTPNYKASYTPLKYKFADRRLKPNNSGKPHGQMSAHWPDREEIERPAKRGYTPANLLRKKP